MGKAHERPFATPHLPAWIIRDRVTVEASSMSALDAPHRESA